MRVLVFPHDMELGGSQLNAVDLAGAMRDRGHAVTLIGGSGVLVDHARELELELIPLDSRVRGRPSMRAVRQLRALIAERGFDVVHGYEWPPAVEGATSTLGAVARPVCTIMSMSIPRFLPRSMPLVVGTRSLAKAARMLGFQHVATIEPPVDTSANSAEAVAPLPRTEIEVCKAALLLVVVGRLVPELKLEGVLAACQAVGRLTSEGIHAHLLVVGDGPAKEQVESAARAANEQAGHSVIHVLGRLPDPRPAYAAADITLGMGGSAIRALCFSKPLIVQGERGFWKILAPESVSEFVENGWYGVGPPRNTSRDGAIRLAGLVRQLVSAETRERLGVFGRRLAENNFSLEGAAVRLEDVYRAALDSGPYPNSLDAASSFVRAMRHVQTRRVKSLWGSVPTDDFNDLSLITSNSQSRV